MMLIWYIFIIGSTPLMTRTPLSGTGQVHTYVYLFKIHYFQTPFQICRISPRIVLVNGTPCLKRVAGTGNGPTVMSARQLVQMPQPGSHIIRTTPGRGGATTVFRQHTIRSGGVITQGQQPMRITQYVYYYCGRDLSKL